MAASKLERRSWLRLDKIFPVIVESPTCGKMNCVARNISAGGIFLETRSPLPLGSFMRIHFSFPNSANAMALEGQVKNHYFLNYSSTDGPKHVMGMGVRFVEISNEEEDVLLTSFDGMAITIH